MVGPLWQLNANPSPMLDEDFSPLDLPNCALYLDGFLGVLSSISPRTIATNGQSVRRWEDQSVNARHVDQTVTNEQPLWSTSGRLTFDGLNDRMSNTAAALLRSAPAASCYFVGRRASNNASEAAGFYVLSSANTRACVTFRNSGVGNTGIGAGGRRLASDSFQGIGSEPYTAATVVTSAVFDWASARLSCRQNFGTEYVRNPFQTAGITEADAGGFWLGANNGLSLLNGEIAAVLIYMAAHSEEQKNALTRYLARRFSVAL